MKKLFVWHFHTSSVQNTNDLNLALHKTKSWEMTKLIIKNVVAIKNDWSKRTEKKQFVLRRNTASKKRKQKQKGKKTVYYKQQFTDAIKRKQFFSFYPYSVREIVPLLGPIWVFRLGWFFAISSDSTLKTLHSILFLTLVDWSN